MERSQHQSSFRSGLVESTFSANSTTITGHPSHLDPTATQDVFPATSEINVDQESRTKSTKGLSPGDSLQDEAAPATTVDFELDLNLLAAHPDHIDWESYFPSTVGDNASNLPLELINMNDDNFKLESVEQASNASVTQPESLFWAGFLFDCDGDAAVEQPWEQKLCNLCPQSDRRFSTGFQAGFKDGTSSEAPLDTKLSVPAISQETQSLPWFPIAPYVSLIPQTHFAGAQEPNSASQNTIDADADLLAPAVEDLPDFFGIYGSPGRELNGSLPGAFELPDSSPALGLLQDLHLIGGKSQPTTGVDVKLSHQLLLLSTGNDPFQIRQQRRIAWNGFPSAGRVAVAGSSEPNPESERRAVLKSPRRLSRAYRGDATQNQPDKSRIQQKNRYIENSAYTPLTQAPETWDIFEYTKDGELEPSSLFSAEEINRFLFTHPLHQGHHDLKESQLKLRVHKTPYSSAKRFPNGLMCRFGDCPMRTINQGHLLVVVDELSVQHPDHDHFLNAAYFHLWCIERYCDFPKMCAKLNVSAEGRNARKEEGRKNKFCLALADEKKVVEDFVEACCANARRGTGGNPWVTHCPDQQTNGCPHFDQQSPPYQGTLCHQLTIAKLHYGGQGRINLRKEREDKAGYEGANITRHLGDLSKEAELRKYSRSHKNQNQLKSNPRNERIYRANGDETEEEKQTGRNHSERICLSTHQRPAELKPEQVHERKRNRGEGDDDLIRDHGIAQVYKKPKHGVDLITPGLNVDGSSGPWSRIDEFENTVDLGGDEYGMGICVAGTPRISPLTTLPHKSQKPQLQLQITTTDPPQDGRSAATDGLSSTIAEDESEGEIELKILAAQRRKRALEIEDAKDSLEEIRLRKFRLEKRAREGRDGDKDGSGSKRKRQRV